MRHSAFRTRLFGALAAVVAAVLLPSVAFACAGPGVIWNSLGWIAGFLCFVTAGYTLISAGVFRCIEKFGNFALDKPGWWLTRIWAVGMVGWVLGIGLAVFIAVLTADAVPHNSSLETAFFVFVVTVPLVCQAAYIARAWYRHDRCETN